MIKNVDIALELFGTLGIGNTGKISSESKKILKHCSHRTDVLKEMIKLCPNPATAKELYIVSTAYAWLGAGYRIQAIEYLERYVKIGGYWEGTPYGTINILGYEDDQRSTSIASVYYDLGKCYEREYMFFEAISAYSSAYEHDSHFAHYVVCVANVLVKVGDYDKALYLLRNVKNSIYYKAYTYQMSDGINHANNDYKITIDSAINDIEDKLKRGYKYKPRPNR